MSIHDTKQGQGALYLYIASKDQRGDCAVRLGFGSGKAILRLWKDWAVIIKWLKCLERLDVFCVSFIKQCYRHKGRQSISQGIILMYFLMKDIGFFFILIY